MPGYCISRCRFVLLLLWFTSAATALETVWIKRGDDEMQVVGKLTVKAQDGGLLLLSQDGVYWPIQPDEIIRHETDDRPFRPCSKAELGKRLRAQLAGTFRVHETAHYVICYNTSEAYAVWCGSLFERLYRAFYIFWENRQIELQPPQFPLPALLFDSRRSYAAYADHELGSDATAVIGYYSMETNRVTTYDLTGIDGLRAPRRTSRSSQHINRILSQPAAERTVATIVHEATHQLAYNSGLQTRYAANPLWVSEGIALFFETPDLSSSRGWRSIGSVNHLHLSHFQSTIDRRPQGELFELLDDSNRFREASTSADAYADAWAFTYFLLRTRNEPYLQYLRNLAQLRPLVDQDPQQRKAAFEAAFGTNVDSLNEEFLRYMRDVE
jgi:hypothetical protein